MFQRSKTMLYDLVDFHWEIIFTALFSLGGLCEATLEIHDRRILIAIWVIISQVKETRLFQPQLALQIHEINGPETLS